MEPTYIAGGDAKWYHHFRKQALVVLQKVKHRVTV